MRRASSSSQVSEDRRVAAPRQLVWNQVGLSPVFFATLPVSKTSIDEAGRSASFEARLAIGPFALTRPGFLEVIDRRPIERVVFEGTLEDESVAVKGTFRLEDPGDHETLLSYDAELQLSHHMPRFRRLLEGLLQEHVADFVGQAARTAERHWKAEQAIADLEREG